jgi:hypothetical protein
MRARLLELGAPPDKVDWLVSRISTENRQNFFICDPSIDELLDTIEKLPDHYDF